MEMEGGGATHVVFWTEAMILDFTGSVWESRSCGCSEGEMRKV